SHHPFGKRLCWPGGELHGRVRERNLGAEWCDLFGPLRMSRFRRAAGEENDYQSDFSVGRCLPDFGRSDIREPRRSSSLFCNGSSGEATIAQWAIADQFLTRIPPNPEGNACELLAPGLRLVQRGLRYARPEAGQGAARGAGFMKMPRELANAKS